MIAAIIPSNTPPTIASLLSSSLVSPVSVNYIRNIGLTRIESIAYVAIHCTLSLVLINNIHV